MTPQVSVVMPVRNGARWLGDAIESVLSQTFSDLELVIIDDGSTDDTPHVLGEYARRDGRVRVIRQSQLGLANALNRGVSEIRAAVIARLDADDRMRPERIDRQIGFFRAYPETGLLGSWAEKIDGHGRHLGWLRPETRARELIATLERTNPFVHSSVMLRSEIVRRLGGYRPAFKAAEDYDLWLRIAEVASIANLPEALVQYRWHGGNVTRREQIRQAFSARLAQSSAKARRDTGIDPANSLAAPPDWNSTCSGTAFFSRDAKMYCLLDVADPSSARSEDDLDFSPIIERFDALSHAERKLAIPAMINYIRRATAPQAARTRQLLLRLLRIRPGLIVPLARSILDASFARRFADREAQPINDPDGRNSEPIYAYCPGWFARERTYRLRADVFEWQDDTRGASSAYKDIVRIEICKERFLGSSASYWRCILYPSSGTKIRLGAASSCGPGRIEDRTASYIPFIKELEARIAAANPRRIVTEGETWLSRAEEWLGHVSVWLLRAMRRGNPDRCADFGAWLLCRVGPWLRGHQIARSQIIAAFPEKSAAEIERILSGMWDNLARLVVEYSQLDRLWDHDLVHAEPGRIEVDAASMARWARVAQDKRPILAFGAHLGNWELATAAMSSGNRAAAILIRPPRIRALAQELTRIRAKSGCTPIPSSPHAMTQIRAAVKRGTLIGMLVDQHHADGIDVVFFGRRCRMNPTFVRLARIFNAQIYGGRIIRLPGRRFRYEIVGPIEPARDAAGKIEIAATMQIIASIIEGWIREHPEQWMWLHRLWR